MNPPQKQHIHQIIFICLLMVVGCDSPTEPENEYVVIDGDEYYQGDLDVLQIFIDNSDSTLNMDMDLDSSGVIEPLELGIQEWVDGRIIELDCFFICRLSKEIPSEIGNLTNLTFLDLGYNLLTGEIPSEIGNLSNLTFLGLGNRLTGGIPSEIWNLTNLEEFDLSFNQLGCYEYDFSVDMEEDGCQVHCNETEECDGYIPSEIGDLINLETLKLSSNQLIGEIPEEIGNLINLETLSLSYNKFSGKIPNQIGYLINLISLGLSSNQLTGEIPSEIGGLINLTELFLKNNQLTGNIPEEICDLIESNEGIYLNIHFITEGNNLTNTCD